MGEVVKLDDFRPCPTANVIVDGVIHHVKVQDIADIEAGKKSIAEFEDPELMGGYWQPWRLMPFCLCWMIPNEPDKR